MYKDVLQKTARETPEGVFLEQFVFTPMTFTVRG